MAKVAAVVAAVAATALAAPDLSTYTFEQYTAQYGRTYTAAETPMRRELFHRRLAAAREHNAEFAAGRVSYRKGVNQFTDRTEEERRGQRGSKLHEQYAAIQELEATSPHVTRYTASKQPLPFEVDYRRAAPAVLTGIKNQGQCGSCWAHAATETLEAHWAIATGQLWVLSQQQFTSCAPDPRGCGGTGGCDGNTVELAYDYLAKTGKGMAEEWTLPYTSFWGDSGFCPSAITSSKVQVTGYTKLPPNDQGAVMDALARVGPLAVNVDASAWSDYTGGIYHGCNYAKNISIDHVVQLVGYGRDESVQKDYWIVRNSWSPSFGEQGYIRLLREATPECGWDVKPQDGTGCKGGPPQLWACGQCGILFDVSYPNVMAP